MFGRRRDTLPGTRFTRSDVSLISELVSEIVAARGAADGLPIAPDRLPIVVGAATIHADMLGAMPAVPSMTDRRITMLCAKPDPTTDYRTTIESGTLAMFYTGYAALLLDAPAPRTTSFRVLEPQAVRPNWDPADSRRVAYWTVDGQNVAADMVHAVNLIDDPRHGPVGESPLERCREALEMYGYAYRYLLNYFAGGGNPSSVLRTAHRLTTADAYELVDEWITARMQHRPAVLDPTVQLEIPPSTGELAATLSVLDHAAAEVARLLNMPGSLVNAPSLGYSLTYANIGDEFRRWLAVSLRPTWVSRWETAFRHLSGDPGVVLDPSGVLGVFDTGAPLPEPQPLAAPPMVPTEPLRIAS